MHTRISLSKALWHQQSVNGPIGRQAESTSLPPSLIHRFEWWDVAKAMHTGADHLEVVYHWNIIRQTPREATLHNKAVHLCRHRWMYKLEIYHREMC